MSFKPRRQGSRNRGGWASIRSSKSHGWGLPRKWPSIPHFNKKRVFGISAIIVLVLGILYAIPNDPLFHSYQAQACSHSPPPGVPGVGGEGSICGDPTTVVWRDDGTEGNLGAWSQGGPRISYLTGNNCGLANVNDKCIQLDPFNGNGSMILSKDPIGPLATANGKSIVIQSQWANGVNCGADSCRGQSNRWGWFLRQGNGTMPNHAITAAGSCNMPQSLSCATYDPYYDPNVVLDTMIFQGTGGSAYSTLWFVQKQQGQSIASEDTGNCPTAQSSCYLALSGSTANPFSHWTFSSLYLNYSGVASGTACAVVANALTGAGCNWGLGNDVTQGPTNAVSSVQIKDSLTSSDYFLGFYEVGTAGTAGWSVEFSFDTIYGNGVGCSNCFGEMDTLIFNANGNAGSVPPQIDTGGFLGPVIRSLISIGVFVLNAVLSFLGFIASAIKIGLNALGNFFGWGNIGDSFINAASGLASSIVAVANAITNFLSGIVARGLDLITLVTTLSGTFFTGLQKFLSEMSTLSSGLVTIVSKLFLYGGAFYFLYDVIMFFSMTGEGGIDGFGAWFGLNKWISFAFFGIMTRILNALISAFDWVLSHIPTVAARMPENGFPGVPQLSAGERPSLFPSANMSKIREGDPGAVFFWIVGGFLILPFYLSSSISPLAGLVAASGCNPTACFNTALTNVGYPFAGIFLLGLAIVAVQSFIFGASGEERPMMVKIANERVSGSPKFPRNVTSGRVKRGSRERRIIARADRFLRAEYGEKR